MTMRTILAEARAIDTLAEPLSTFKMASPWRSDVIRLAIAKQKNPAVAGEVKLGSQSPNGIETDFQWAGEKRQHNWSDPGSTCTNDDDFIPPNCNAGPAYVASEWRLRWFGTLRGRVGFLVAPTWLAYITGGLAYGNAEYNFAFSQPGAGISYSLTNSVTNIGWTLGGGLETKMADRWTMKVEYLYIDLGEQTINTVDNDGNPFSVQNKLHDNILRVGLNYKLN